MHGFASILAWMSVVVPRESRAESSVCAAPAGLAASLGTAATARRTLTLRATRGLPDVLPSRAPSIAYAARPVFAELKLSSRAPMPTAPRPPPPLASGIVFVALAGDAHATRLVNQVAQLLARDGAPPSVHNFFDARPAPDALLLVFGDATLAATFNHLKCVKVLCYADAADAHCAWPQVRIDDPSAAARCAALARHA